MLTRRTFLTTIAAAPLAAFCKTEPRSEFCVRYAGQHTFVPVKLPLPAGARITGTFHVTRHGDSALVTLCDHDADSVEQWFYHKGTEVGHSERRFNPAFTRRTGLTSWHYANEH
jgi:hypothetical protein